MYLRNLWMQQIQYGKILQTMPELSFYSQCRFPISLKTCVLLRMISSAWNWLLRNQSWWITTSQYIFNFCFTVTKLPYPSAHTTLLTSITEFHSLASPLFVLVLYPFIKFDLPANRYRKRTKRKNGKLSMKKRQL